MEASNRNVKKTCAQMPNKWPDRLPTQVRAGRGPIHTGVWLLRNQENRYRSRHQFSGLHGKPGATGALEGVLKMATSWRLFLLLIAVFILAVVPASGVDGADPDAGNAGGAERALSSKLAGGWHLVRTHDPNGGADAISIMHTAD